jgi:hypothetical protein
MFLVKTIYSLLNARGRQAGHIVEQRIVADFSPRRTGFSPREIHSDKEHVFSPSLSVFPVSIIPPLLHIHSFTMDRQWRH